MFYSEPLNHWTALVPLHPHSGGGWSLETTLSCLHWPGDAGPPKCYFDAKESLNHCRDRVNSWVFSVNIVELLSAPAQEFLAAPWSSPFRSFWGMGFGRLGHNLLRGYSPNTANFTLVLLLLLPLSLLLGTFWTRGKGFFQRTCSIDRHNQEQQDDIHRWPPTPESRSLHVFCQSTVALCSPVFWWKAHWCAMPMVYQLSKLLV